jgi:putative ABC transport system permease protein
VLLATFAAVALLLSAVGLYAVLSYAVSLRRQEIGLRMALGASALRVRAMVLGQCLALAGAGIASGLAAAVALARLLQTELYQVSPTDPATYAAAPALLLAVSILAALLPTGRAARIDPGIALRHD